MAFPARFADGRAAVMHDVTCEIGETALVITHAGQAITWSYTDLRRTDDGNGRVILRLREDNGERLQLGDDDGRVALLRAAPALFSPRAQGVEGSRVVVGLTAMAAALAAGFLIGLPMLSEPVARVLPEHFRQQLGDMAWAQVEAGTQMCDDSDAASIVLNDLARRLMTAGNVPGKDDVWVTIVHADVPNAFALPDNSIVITDQLIAMAEQPDELAGVLAHEIGHIQHHHIMTAVVRQIGASFLFDTIFGLQGAGSSMSGASSQLASLRFSRGDEGEADRSGFGYMEAAHMNAGATAALFDRVEAISHTSGIPTFILDHPPNAERAAAARSHLRQGLAPALNERNWRIVRSACGGNPAAAPTPAPANPGRGQTPEKPAASPAPN